MRITAADSPCGEVFSLVGKEIKKRIKRNCERNQISFEAWALHRGIDPGTLRRVMNQGKGSKRMIELLAEELETTSLDLFQSALAGVAE